MALQDSVLRWTASACSDLAAWWDSLLPGHHVDVLDTVGKWCVCQVLDKEQDRLHVHYWGWSNKWDEWVPSNSERIAPLHTHCHPDLPSDLRVRVNSTEPRFGVLRNDSQLFRDIAKLLGDERTADMVMHAPVSDSEFSLEDQVSVYLHRRLLECRFPEVQLSNIPWSELSVVLRFCYDPCHTLELLHYRNVMAVLCLAQELNVSGLETLCWHFLDCFHDDPGLVLRYATLRQIETLSSDSKHHLQRWVLQRLKHHCRELKECTEVLSALQIPPILRSQDDAKEGDVDDSKEPAAATEDQLALTLPVLLMCVKQDMLDDLEALFKSRGADTCDLKIYLHTNPEPLYAHKAVLYVRSEFFRGLISSGMTDESCVCIEEPFSMEAMIFFLKFLYTGSLSGLSVGLCMELLSICQFLAPSSHALETSCKALCGHYLNASWWPSLMAMAWSLEPQQGGSQEDSFLHVLISKLRSFQGDEIDRILETVGDMDRAKYIIKALAAGCKDSGVVVRASGGQQVVFPEDNVQCRDRRATYLLSNDLSALCDGLKIASMQQVFQCFKAACEANARVVPVTDCPSPLAHCEEDGWRGVVGEEYVELEAKAVYVRLLDHVTKLPFSR